MFSRTLMMASSLFMAIAGFIASFFPQEILHYLELTTPRLAIVIIQILGALYLGFALLNWMAKGVLIGGIYGKPLLMGNLLHFMMVALALIKTSVNHPSLEIILGLIMYSILAAGFCYLLFNTPKAVSE